MALSKVFRRNTDVVDRQILDETLLVPIRGQLSELQRIFALNPVGEFIWAQLDGTQDLSAVTRKVAEAFEVTAKEAEADVMGFVEELAAAGLVSELPAR